MKGRIRREFNAQKRIVLAELPTLAFGSWERAEAAWGRMAETITGAATSTALAMAIASMQAELLTDGMGTPPSAFFGLEIEGGDGPTDPRVRAAQVLGCVLNHDYDTASDLFLVGGPENASAFYSAQVALLRSLAQSRRPGGGEGS